MKNKFFLFLMMLGMAFAVGCGDDPAVTDEPTPGPGPGPGPEPEIEVSMEAEVLSVGASQAELKLTTKNIKQYAWKAYTAGEQTTDPSFLYLFTQGKTGECQDGENTITINGLSANSSYDVFIAGMDASDNYYDEMVKVTFDTKSFTDEVSIFDVTLDSYNIHVNVNDRVKEGMTAYRWLLQDFSIYNYLVATADRHDVFMLELNDYFWGNFLTNDHTFIFDNKYENRYICDENGNLYTDDAGEAFPLYPFIVPGGANYFILGEYRWGKNPFFSYGDDLQDIGWYDPLIDWEAWDAHVATGAPMNPAVDSFWTGYHYRELIRTEKPNLIRDANHQADLSGLKPYGGVFTLIPDERCTGVQMFFCDKEMLQSLKYMCFQNDDALYEEFLPAFTISEASMQLAEAMYFPCEDQNINIDLGRLYWVNQGETYYWVINGHGPETKTINGQQQPTFENQYFKIIEFQIPKSTMPVPTIEVSAVSSDDPYTVAFNIKCPTKDAAYVDYFCDYEAEWLADNMNDEAQLINMFKAYGAYSRLTGENVLKINSDAGLTIEIPSRPNALSYFAAVGYNEDQVMGKPAITSNMSAKLPVPDPVDQARFEEVAGEWTATANIAYTPAGSDKAVIEPKTSHVTIGDVAYPKETPQEVYDAYPRKDEDEIDAMYAEFTQLIDDFNFEHRTYNRTICQGFDFQVPAEGFQSYLRYADPYTLFVAPAEVYNGTTNSSIIWEFGPKWYIEFQADGTAYVPFDVETFAPMTAWIPEGYDYHLIAANILDGKWSAKMPEGCKGFPVEISADKNTITVKGLELTWDDGSKTTLYPQPAFEQTQSYNAYTWIVSEVVLTRNNTTAAAAARLNAAPATGVKAQKMTIDRKGGEFVKPAKFESNRLNRTHLVGMEMRGTINTEMEIVTAEKFHQNGDRLIQKYFGGNR